MPTLPDKHKPIHSTTNRFVNRTFTAWIFFALIAAILQGSCTKLDTTELGNELIPPVDTISTFDTTLDLITNNEIFQDTGFSIYGQPHGIGIIDDDAEFGRTEAKSFISFSPASYKVYPFSDRSNVIVDSVILSLGYSSAFGDSTSVQQFDVQEIDPSASFDSYYATGGSSYRITGPDFPVTNSVLGSAVVDLSKLSGKDSARYVDDKDTIVAKELRIPLSTSFATRFIEGDTLGLYANDTNFKAQFKGFRIAVNDGASLKKKAISYFTITDAATTKLSFYCRITRSGVVDTIVAKFVHTDLADAQANNILRTPLHGYLTNTTNNLENEEQLYIQTTPGSYSDITIRDFDKFPNCVIHRAELIFEKYPSADDVYKQPAALYLEALSAEKDSAFTLRNDFVPSSTYPFYNITDFGGSVLHNDYSFNISRYIQSVVTHKFPNYVLRLQAPYRLNTYYMPANSNTIPVSTAAAPNKYPILLNVPVAAGRVVLYGGAAPDRSKRARLHIIYSRL
jgi:Domain of unknown function (DUF4270)